MKLKKFIPTFLFLLIGVLAFSCGDSSSNSSSGRSSDSLSAISGKWKVSWSDGGTLYTLKTEIKSSGTGTVELYFSRPTDTGWRTMVDERVNFERVGDVLYYHASGGEKGNFIIRNNTLYTADGQMFSKGY